MKHFEVWKDHRRDADVLPSIAIGTPVVGISESMDSPFRQYLRDRGCIGCAVSKTVFSDVFVHEFSLQHLMELGCFGHAESVQFVYNSLWQHLMPWEGLWL